MKTVLIPLSSGLDSTYLIYKAMKEGLNIKLFVTELTNNKKQLSSESVARIKIIKLFRSEKFLSKYDLRGKIDENVMVSTLEVSNSTRLVLSQPPIWILTSLYAMPYDVDEIWFGYIGGDDTLGYLDDIRDIYKSLESFLLIGQQFPSIKFPLRRRFKYDIINDIPKELLDVISYCEYPTYKNKKYIPCDKCDSCIEMKKTLSFYNDIDNITSSK